MSDEELTQELTEPSEIFDPVMLSDSELERLIAEFDRMLHVLTDESHRKAVGPRGEPHQDDIAGRQAGGA
jgi:hypothetical protein